MNASLGIGRRSYRFDVSKAVTRPEQAILRVTDLHVAMGVVRKKVIALRLPQARIHDGVRAAMELRSLYVHQRFDDAHVLSMRGSRAVDREHSEPTRNAVSSGYSR
ncbi:MAG: hypothetical protein OES46_11890 [Gammaproteobacteria bacterium]|nr:hypothetical protein [Gammaproteobacteria bacterium]